MRRFFASVRNEQHKFLTWKKTLLLLLLVVVLALILIPIAEIAFKSADNIIPSDGTINKGSEYDHLKGKYEFHLRELEKLSPDDVNYTSKKTTVLLIKHELDILYRLDSVDMMYQNPENVLALGSYFAIGIFAIVIVFSCLIVSREYTTKDILPIATSPSGRVRTFGAKFLLMSLFCLVSVIIFFTIIGLYSMKFHSEFGRLAIFYNNAVTSVTMPIAYTVAACMTLFASIMIGSIALLVSSIIRSPYITLPVTLFLVIFLAFYGTFMANLQSPSVFPLWNTMYYPYLAPSNSFAPNPPWAFFLINIVTIIVMGVLGCLVFSKRQVKE